MPPDQRRSKPKAVDTILMSRTNNEGGTGGKPPGGVASGRPPRGPGSRKEDWIAIQLRPSITVRWRMRYPEEMMELLSALDDSDEDGQK